MIEHGGSAGRSSRRLSLLRDLRHPPSFPRTQRSPAIVQRILSCIAVLVLLAGCTRNPQYAQLTHIPLAEKPTIPATQSDCEAAGQFWTQQGLPGGPKSCAVKTTDAFKICTDSRQCQGSCLVANDLPEGAQAIGSCSEWVANFGCHKFIDGGRVRMMCAD
ncbi:hypothetical protein [Xanthomonas tesorieronis]|uniref:hypothetical protein n=1 Tax=Xanthomonas tesorieronis TaxID=3160839 RepID=UPI003512BF60